MLILQLLKHVTIASGGVIPRIHPELLIRKKGGKVVLPVTPKPVIEAKKTAAAKTTNLVKTTNKKSPTKTAAPAVATKTADKGTKKAVKKGKGAVS